MTEMIKWTAIVSAVIFLILFVVMTVLYFKKASNCNDKITKIDLVYSKANNPKLRDSVETKIEAFLIEKSSDIYLVIPGFGTQNKLSWTKLASNDTNPTEVKSNIVTELKQYRVVIAPTQLPGYFNNCGNFQNAEWILDNGILICKPFMYSTSGRSYQQIDLKNCGGTSIGVGDKITSNFGSTVIKLEKK